MSTIEGDDHRSDNDLIKHLKDSDFFDVKISPFSTIAITKVRSINDDKEVTGNLTIKGITLPVNSGKFYDKLADQTISDSIEFNIKVVAKK